MIWVPKLRGYLHKRCI